MDRNASYAYQDDVEEEDEIEIVEVKPESFSSLEDVCNVTEVDNPESEAEEKSEDDDKSGIENSAEFSFAEVKEESVELKLESTDEDDSLPDEYDDDEDDDDDDSEMISTENSPGTETKP